MNMKSAIRWSTVAVFGAFGLYCLWGAIAAGTQIAEHQASDGFSWFSGGFLILLTLLVALVPLSIAWFAYRRDYRSLLATLSALGTVAVFGGVLHLVTNVRIERYFMSHTGEPWMVMLGLPLAFAMLFAPFYAARWFSRFSLRYLDRFTTRSV